MNAVTKMYNFQMREIWKYYDCMKKSIAMISKITSNNIYSTERSLVFILLGLCLL